MKRYTRYGEGAVQIATLWKQASLPIKFLELILLDLRASGLLESKKDHGADIS